MVEIRANSKIYTFYIYTKDWQALDANRWAMNGLLHSHKFQTQSGAVTSQQTQDARRIVVVIHLLTIPFVSNSKPLYRSPQTKTNNKGVFPIGLQQNDDSSAP